MGYVGCGRIGEYSCGMHSVGFYRSVRSDCLLLSSSHSDQPVYGHGLFLGVFSDIYMHFIPVSAWISRSSPESDVFLFSSSYNMI